MLVLDFDFGSHAVYVWSAWGLSFLTLLFMAVSPSLRWLTFKRRADMMQAPQQEDAQE